MQDPLESLAVGADTTLLRRRVEILEQSLEEALAELEALRARARRVDGGLDALPFALALLDGDGALAYANRSFCDRFGPTGNDGGVPEPDAHPELAEAVAGLRETDEPCDVDLFPGLYGKADAGHFRLRGYPLQLEDGECCGHLLVLEDLDAAAEGGERDLGLERLRRIIAGAVEAMSVMVERRDPFVAGHQKRVGELAGAIALEMGHDGFESEGVKVAGQLHDIGKVSIPTEILCKPAALNRAEERIVRTHPVVAHRILKRVDFPWPVADIVLQHTERYDGSGYPTGLDGSKLHFQAKIIAVADAVEAMLTYRPYRPAYSKPEVLEMIERERGRAFDPDVVDACLRLFREKKFEFAQA
jgi:putative nucleotidyltransferase with HDIG domain